MSELGKQPTNPVQPVDHAHAPGQDQSQGQGQGQGQGPDRLRSQDQGTKPSSDRPGSTPADQHQPAQADQKRGPADATHASGQAGPSAGNPDVQRYMNLDKQGPNTSAQPAHGGADATPLQTVPSAADHAAPAAPAGAHPETARPETARPADAAQSASPGHVADTRHTSATEATHPAETKPPAEATKHSADAQHGGAAAAANAPGAASGAHDRAADTRAAHDVHETPADRELRLQLQPYGVTPEQARDYMRIALVPQLQLNPMTRMTVDEIQRAGHAVAQLPQQQLDHLTTQAKALDSGPHPARQTVDLSHLPAVPRFNLDPAPPAKIQLAPQVRIGTVPQPPNNPLNQPMAKPADQQNDLAKKTAAYAAQGNPYHHVGDVPDSARVTQGDWNKIVDMAKDATGAAKLTHILESNGSQLSHELTRNPAMAAATILTAVAIVAGSSAADMATRRPIDPDAPSPTTAGPTSALGQLLDSHLASVGGLKALNAVLGLLGNHPAVSVGLDITPGTRASRDGAHPASPGEVKGTVGLGFEF